MDKIISTRNQHYFKDQLINFGNMDYDSYPRFGNHGYVENILFDHSNFESFVSRKANFKDCYFNCCVFSDVDLEADFPFTRCIFKNCVFSEPVRIKGRLEEVYFIGCSFHHINFTELTISNKQATYYPFQSCNFGINVNEEDINMSILLLCSQIQKGGIAWKKVNMIRQDTYWPTQVVLKLEIPMDAKIRSIGLNKSRVSKCKPVEVYYVNEFKEVPKEYYGVFSSLFSSTFIYEIGEIATPCGWVNSYLTCGPGIHCYGTYIDAARHE